MKLVALAFVLALTGCVKPHAPEPAAPPSIRVVPESKSYPKQTAHPGDMAVYGCTVTAEQGNRADCLCRKAATKIDARDSSKQSLICK